MDVGPAHYDFLEAVQLVSSWNGDGWTCWAREIGLAYEGEGSTPREARQNWERLVHADFQRLYAMRPFEMEEPDRAKWASLLSVIDVNGFRERSPLSIRQIGRVRWRHFPYPVEIDWIDGGAEKVPMDKAPPEFAGYKPGQWVEAVCRREPGTRQLIQIDYIQKIATVHRPSNRELQRRWTDLPRADLPETGWDWPE